MSPSSRSTSTPTAHSRHPRRSQNPRRSPHSRHLRRSPVGDGDGDDDDDDDEKRYSSSEDASSTDGHHRHARSITLVEPVRRHRDKPPPIKHLTKRSKAVRALSNGLGFALHLLGMCCVLSGEQRPPSESSSRPRSRGRYSNVAPYNHHHHHPSQCRCRSCPGSPSRSVEAPARRQVAVH